MLLYNTYDGKRADLWSLGALLFWLLAGEEPFTAGIPPDLPQARGHLFPVSLRWRCHALHVRNVLLWAVKPCCAGTVHELPQVRST